MRHTASYASRRPQTTIVTVIILELADFSIVGADGMSFAFFCYFCPVMTALTTHSFHRPCSDSSSQPPTAGVDWPHRSPGSRDSHKHLWAIEEAASSEDDHTYAEGA